MSQDKLVVRGSGLSRQGKLREVFRAIVRISGTSQTFLIVTPDGQEHKTLSAEKRREVLLLELWNAATLDTEQSAWAVAVPAESLKACGRESDGQLRVWFGKPQDEEQYGDIFFDSDFDIYLAAVDGKIQIAEFNVNKASFNTADTHLDDLDQLRLGFGKHDYLPYKQTISGYLDHLFGIERAWLAESGHFIRTKALKPAPQYILAFTSTDNGVTLRFRQPEYWNDDSIALLTPEGRPRFLVDVTLPAAYPHQLWNLTIRPTREGIEHVKRGQNVTFLPDLPPTGPPWVLTMLLIDSYGTSSVALKVASSAALPPSPDDRLLYPRELSPLQGAAPIPLTYPGVRPQEKQPAPITRQVRLLPLASVIDNAPSPSAAVTEARWLEPALNVPLNSAGLQPRTYGLTVGFRVQDVGVGDTGTNTVLRLQGLEATISTAATDTSAIPPDDNLGYGFVHFSLEAASKSAGVAHAAYVTGRAVWPLSALRPGGQSDVPGAEYCDPSEPNENRLPSVVIPLTGGGTKEADKILARLTAEDRITPQTSHRPVIRLRGTGNYAVPLDAVVLDLDPFGVYRVGAEALGESPTTNEIGNWQHRADGGFSWQIRLDPDKLLSLWLPPQAIGEAMHRAKDAGDVKGDELAEMRFTRPARIGISPAEEVTRFGELPWNLRRRLGYPGQRTPGALVQEVYVEPLYGLKAWLQWRRGVQLRVAEVAARLGVLPNVLPPLAPSKPGTQSTPAEVAAAAAYDQYQKDWERLRRQVQQRPAVLEPYVPGARPPAPGAHEPLVLTSADGLTISLDEGANLHYPIAGEMPASLKALYETTWKDGLKGSFTWAFESANIYEQLWRTPTATEAELRGLLFSALGGWAQVRAAFAGGNTIVIASTEQGRVSRLQVERRGRIARFWNRARHVVVYERTVAASMQFAAEQVPFVGVALIRKTQEYVEIDQPWRALAEGAPADGQTLLAAGLVRGCTFPGSPGEPVRIPVSSRWGTDVGTIGWQVPLWHPAAAADLYPRPDVRLLCAADGPTADAPPPLGSADVSDNLRGLADPDKLVFFTLTTDVGSPPDSWGAIRGVDYAPLSPDDEAPRPESEERQYNVPPRAVLPALAPFTLTLNAGRPLNLVAGRQANAVVADLTTVTVMRGPLIMAKRASDSAEAMQKALDSGRAVSATLVGELLKVRQALGSATLADAPEAARAALLGKLKAAVARARIQVEIDAKRAVVDFNTGLSKLNINAASLRLDTARQRLSAADAAVRARLRDHLTHVLTQSVPVAAMARKLVYELISAGQNTDVVLRALEDEIKQITGKLKTLPDTPAEVLALVEAAQEALEKERVAALQKQLKEALDDLIGKPDADRLLIGAVAEAQRAVDHLLDLCRAIGNRWLGGFPSRLLAQASQAYDTLRATLLEMRHTAATAQVELEVLRGKFDPQLVAVAEALNDAINAPLGEAGKSLVEIAKELQTATTAQLITPVLEALTARLQAALPAQGTGEPLNEYAARAAAALEAAAVAAISDLTQETNTVLTAALKGLHTYATEQVGTLLQVLGEAPDRLPDPSVLLEAYEKALDTAISDAKIPLRALRDRFDGLLDVVRAPAVDLAGMAESLLRYEPAVRLLQQSGEQYFRETAGELRATLIRAFGDAPRVPGLEFAQDALRGVGYRFLPLLNAAEEAQQALAQAKVLFTDLEAQAGSTARALGEDALDALGLTLPSRELTDVLLPAFEGGFSLDKLFQHLAGLPIKYLFQAVKLPKDAQKYVKLRQVADPQTRSQRLYVEVDLPFNDQSVPVFAMAGISLTLQPGARLRALATVEQQGLGVRTTVRGSIEASWLAQVGGFPLVVLRDCALRFDESGKLSFDIRPEKIELQAVLSFVTEAMAKFASGTEGLSIARTERGIQAVFDLPLPDLAAGTFSLTNVHLRFQLGLEGGKPFRLSTALGLSQEDAPFNLSVFILGGGGWFNWRLLYTPETGRFETHLSLALVASAGLALNLGPVHGSVFAYFGIRAEFSGGGSLSIGVLLMFTGTVRLLKLVEVSLQLLLQATYRDGQLVGLGRISYSIKIGWFIRIKVKKSVEYTYGKAKSRSGGGAALAGGAAPALTRGAALTAEAGSLVDGTTGGRAADFASMSGAAPGLLAPASSRYAEAARQYVDMFED